MTGIGKKKHFLMLFFLCGYIQMGRTYIYIVKECQFCILIKDFPLVLVINVGEGCVKERFKTIICLNNSNKEGY